MLKKFKVTMNTIYDDYELFLLYFFTMVSTVALVGMIYIALRMNLESHTPELYKFLAYYFFYFIKEHGFTINYIYVIFIIISSFQILKFLIENTHSNKSYTRLKFFIFVWVFGAIFVFVWLYFKELNNPEELIYKIYQNIILVYYLIFLGIFLLITNIKWYIFRVIFVEKFDQVRLNDFIIRKNTCEKELSSQYNVYYKAGDIESGQEAITYQQFKKGVYNTIVFKKGDKLQNFILSGDKHADDKESILIIKENCYRKKQYYKVKIIRGKRKFIYFFEIEGVQGEKVLTYSVAKRFLLKKRNIENTKSIKNLNNYLLQNHYYVGDKTKKIMDLILEKGLKKNNNKALAVEGFQGSGKTTFFKYVIKEKLNLKPVFISLWNEGTTDDPLSVIANSLMNDFSVIENIRFRALRLNFSIFTFIGCISMLIVTYKFIVTFFANDIYGRVVNGITFNYEFLLVSILLFIILIIYFILNYIELPLLLFKTGNTTNDRTKFLKFISKSMVKRVLIIEDFERIEDAAKYDRWIAEIDALNKEMELNGVRIIITYSNKNLLKKSKNGLLSESTRQRILVEELDLVYESQIEEYIELLSCHTNRDYSKCINFREIDEIKNNWEWPLGTRVRIQWVLLKLLRTFIMNSSKRAVVQ